MISIITPSFNQGKYIERTILSVLTQNIANLEYVVVDGGSQDETVAILQQYQGQLYFVSEPDRGQAHAVNKGLAMTSGDIIGWLNSDDIYYPNALSKMMELFKKHPEIDVIYGNANHINDEDQIIEPYPTQSWDLEKLKNTCFLSQPAVFFRRRVIQGFGILNESLHFCLDYEYWLRLALGGAVFSYLPDLLAGSRLYPETKTLSSPQKAQLEAIRMLQNQLGTVPSAWLVKDAIAFVKQRPFLKVSQLSYLSSIFLVSMAAAFRWNGLVNGMKSCVELPKTMLSFRH